MIRNQIRTLEAGTTGLVWARLEDDAVPPQDLSGLTVELAEVSPAGVQSAWSAPADEDTSVPGVYRAALQHVAAATVDEWWTLKARVTNGALVEVITVGQFLVVP